MEATNVNAPDLGARTGEHLAAHCRPSVVKWNAGLVGPVPAKARAVYD